MCTNRPLCSVCFRAIMLHLPISECFLAMAMITGLVMYAFYYGCDPLKLGVVSKGDQVRQATTRCVG